MFTLSFETNNAAFDSCPEAEIARILRALADRIEDVGDDAGKLSDVNGNSVGAFSWEAPDEYQA